MLRELRIKNFAIIDELSVSFGPGLNVLTGETGAGKSIIADALGVALGERAYVEMLKTGAEGASVQASFERLPAAPLALAENLGIEHSGELIMRRNITATGKGRAYVNDTMVSVQGLLDVGRTLVDIHGQHEHQSLLKKESQLVFIDSFGGLTAQRDRVAKLFAEAVALRRRRDAMTSDERERARRLDLLQHQCGEIESAALTAGEDLRLEDEVLVLRNLTKLRELFESSYSLVYGDEGATAEKLSSAVSMLTEMSEIDPNVTDPLKVLEEASVLVLDAAATLRALKDTYQADPARLEEVEDRVQLIKDLKRKYGDTIEAVRKYKEDAALELVALEGSEDEAEELGARLEELETELSKESKKLSDKRRGAAAKAAAAVQMILLELALEKSEFVIDIREAQVSATGADDVEFLFSANPGEAPKSLAKVASGGELSRVMLAVKSILRGGRGDGGEGDIPVLVFDEVDAGIGGATADNVADKLKALARGRQVLCITHLAQIASRADRHYLIEKAQKKSGVYVKVKHLSDREKKEEIARMLGGKVSETSLRHAAELIERNR